MGKKLGKILGGGAKPKKVKLPPVEKPAPMPDEQELRRAQARAMAAKFKGKGSRADTILTQDDQTLG